VLEGGVKKLRVLDLFSGIGGFSLGLERTGGFETVAFCEIDPFCRKVLAKHWPNVRQYEDVRELTADRLAADGIAVDVITGGFPCQDISTAGRQAGIAEGTRSGLWSEIARLAGELRPRFVIVENVANLLSGPSGKPGGWFGRVLGDLAALRYDAEWHCIPASYIGAPHRRDRIWVVAYASSVQCDGSHVHSRSNSQSADAASQPRDGRADVADTDRQGLEGWGLDWVGSGEWPAGKGVRSIPGEWLPEPNVGRVAHGVPRRVDRLRSLGNAVVPQIPELIGRAILAAEAA
jgi:DNA (cytosine-5)-methyltransferase 1